MKLTIFTQNQRRSAARRRLASFLGVAAALAFGSATLDCQKASAQQVGGATQDNATGGNAVGGNSGSGTMFQGGEVDMSAFEGIERSDSIGTSTRQGFGVSEDASAAPGGARGGLGGAGGLGGGLGGLGGLFGALGGAFGSQQGPADKPVIRTRLRSAVEVQPLPEDVVQRSANRVFNYAPPRSGVRGVNVTMDGRTAILTGVVATQKDRRMSELLIRLEPGVSKIDNRVQVAGN